MELIHFIKAWLGTDERGQYEPRGTVGLILTCMVLLVAVLIFFAIMHKYGII